MKSAIHFWFRTVAANCRFNTFAATASFGRSPLSGGGHADGAGRAGFGTHQPLDPMLSARPAFGQHVVPDTAGTIGPVAGHEACPDPGAQTLVLGLMITSMKNGLGQDLKAAERPTMQ